MTYGFKVGQQVVKIFKTGPLECAVVGTLTRGNKKGGWVQLQTDEHLKYRADDGTEIDPAPGFAAAGISSRIIPMDGE